MYYLNIINNIDIDLINLSFIYKKKLCILIVLIKKN